MSNIQFFKGKSLNCLLSVPFQNYLSDYLNIKSNIFVSKIIMKYENKNVSFFKHEYFTIYLSYQINHYLKLVNF